MSRHDKERRKHGDGRKRSCGIGVTPDEPPRMGVAVGWQGDAEDDMSVIAPDEARTIAAEIEGLDPWAADKLRALAHDVPVLAKGLRGRGEEVAVIGPTITGPHALEDWVRRWREGFRAGYAAALATGYPPDTVVWAMPRTESLDDPPVGFDLRGLAEARDMLARFLPSPLADPPLPGSFYVVASRSAGRFKGTVVVVLSASGDVVPGTAESN